MTTDPKRLTAFKDIKPGQTPNYAKLDTEFDNVYAALKDLQKQHLVAHDGDGKQRLSTLKPGHFKDGTFDPILAQIQDASRKARYAIDLDVTSVQNLISNAKGIYDDTLKTKTAVTELFSQSGNTLQQTQALADATNRDRGLSLQALTASTTQAADAQTAASSARIAEDMAYRWADKVDGPVYVENGGDPVDDGYYSAHWWALYAETTLRNGSFWYLGPLAVEPTTDNNGNPLIPGHWYYNTTDGVQYLWDGNVWDGIALGETVSSVFGRTGAVQPQENDYSGFFYTKFLVDAFQAAQDADISQNAADISQNAADIAANVVTLGDHANYISLNQLDIQANAADIAQNSADITTNVEGIIAVDDAKYDKAATYSKAEIDALIAASQVAMQLPVGTVISTSVSTNPADLYGYGTWVAYAQGRAPVGVGGGWSGGEERGSETHTLTLAQMPVHNHQIGSFTVSSGGQSSDHSHGSVNFTSNAGIGGNALDVQTTGGGAHRFGAHSGGTSNNHTHNTTIPTKTTTSKGSGSSHNNVQPSVGTYMWRRTA